jgi:hypothetical protein
MYEAFPNRHDDARNPQIIDVMIEEWTSVDGLEPLEEDIDRMYELLVERYGDDLTPENVREECRDRRKEESILSYIGGDAPEKALREMKQGEGLLGLSDIEVRHDYEENMRFIKSARPIIDRIREKVWRLWESR